MKFSIKKLPKSEIEIDVEISAKELEGFFDQAVKDFGKNMEIKGFRKGEAPREIVEREIGREKILADAAEIAIKANYLKIIEKEKISPLGQPQVEIQKLAANNPLVFKIKIAVFSEITLPDYKKIVSKIKKNKIKLDEKEIDGSIKWLQKSRAKFSQLDRPAQKGDFVEIEFDSSVDNKTTKDGFILGEGKFIPGFEDNLHGLKTEDKKTFSLHFPSPYFKKELAGKEAEFNVKVISVQKMELPEVNDKWAQSLGRFDGLKPLKENIREGLKKEKEIAETQRVRGEMLEKITKDSKLEIPDILVKAEQKRFLENLKQRISDNLKISFEEYLKESKKDEKQLLDSFLPEAEKRVKESFILRAVAEKEDIKVSTDEIDKESDNVLKQYPPSEKTPEKIDIGRLKEYVKEVIKNEKTFKKLEAYSV